MRSYMPVVFILLVVTLAACQPAGVATPTGQPQPQAITPEAGKGALVGQVQGAAAIWPEDTVLVYAAPYTRVNAENGYYVLEPNVHPHIELAAGGDFALNNIDPGEYVLVVGPEPRQARLVVGADGKPRVFPVTAGQVGVEGALELAK